MLQATGGAPPAAGVDAVVHRAERAQRRLRGPAPRRRAHGGRGARRRGDKRSGRYAERGAVPPPRVKGRVTLKAVGIALPRKRLVKSCTRRLRGNAPADGTATLISAGERS